MNSRAVFILSLLVTACTLLASHLFLISLQKSGVAPATVSSRACLCKTLTCPLCIQRLGHLLWVLGDGHARPSRYDLDKCFGASAEMATEGFRNTGERFSPAKSGEILKSEFRLVKSARFHLFPDFRRSLLTSSDRSILPRCERGHAVQRHGWISQVSSHLLAGNKAPTSVAIPGCEHHKSGACRLAGAFVQNGGRDA